jgi:hypothetical protein
VNLKKITPQFFKKFCDFISDNKERESEQCEKVLEEVWKIRAKRNRLEESKSSLKNRLVDNQQIDALETILTSQEQIVRSHPAGPQAIILSNLRKLGEAKEKLSEVLSEEEIENICREQVELTKLELKLGNYQKIKSLDIEENDNLPKVQADQLEKIFL